MSAYMRSCMGRALVSSSAPFTLQGAQQLVAHCLQGTTWHASRDGLLHDESCPCSLAVGRLPLSARVSAPAAVLRSARLFGVVLGQEAYVCKRLSVLQVNTKVAMAEEATIRASKGAMADRQSRKARPTADPQWQEERAILGAKVCPFFYRTHSPSVSSG